MDTGKKKRKTRRGKRNKNKNPPQTGGKKQVEEQEKQEEEIPDQEDTETNETPALKRNFEHDDDDDSETEQKPKRKKKKKPVALETGDKKGKMSIRQMKKEKFAQRQAEAQAVAKDGIKSQCLTYLSQWKHDRQNWKFMKAKQVWLFKNKFSSQLVPDQSWPMLLEYFETTKGNIRNMLLEDSSKVIKQMDDWSEKNKPGNDEEMDDEDSEKPSDSAYKRARDLIQCLQE